MNAMRAFATRIPTTKVAGFLIASLAGPILLSGLAAPAAAQENVPVTSVTVTAAKPGKSDLARLRKAKDLPPGLADREVEEKHDVYVVKVAAKVEPGPGQAAVAIGGKEVPVVGTYDGGFFLRVHDDKRLAEWAGQDVRVYVQGPGGEIPAVDSGALGRFPEPPSGNPDRLNRPTVDEALKRDK